MTGDPNDGQPTSTGGHRHEVPRDLLPCFRKSECHLRCLWQRTSETRSSTCLDPLRMARRTLPAPEQRCRADLGGAGVMRANERDGRNVVVEGRCAHVRRTHADRHGQQSHCLQVDSSTYAQLSSHVHLLRSSTTTVSFQRGSESTGMSKARRYRLSTSAGNRSAFRRMSYDESSSNSSCAPDVSNTQRPPSFAATIERRRNRGGEPSGPNTSSIRAGNRSASDVQTALIALMPSSLAARLGRTPTSVPSGLLLNSAVHPPSIGTHAYLETARAGANARRRSSSPTQ